MNSKAFKRIRDIMLFERLILRVAYVYRPRGKQRFLSVRKLLKYMISFQSRIEEMAGY